MKKFPLALLVLPLASCGFIDVENIDDTDDNPCFSRSGGDGCSDPEPYCVDGFLPLVLTDDINPEPDGSLNALADLDRMQDCANLYVGETGHYHFFGANFAGSCATQLDESAFFTISNSCNATGWPAERNAGDRFVVQDPDNTPPCSSDEECGAGRSCVESDGTSCCVANRIFLGTFLLVASEPNMVCMNHWCPAYDGDVGAGRDPGFVLDGCRAGNSLHMSISAIRGCLDHDTLHRCSWGCGLDGCNPDPCDTMSCDAFCKDGVCLDSDPCASMACEHGCFRGRCLQNRNARGPDIDGDGYSNLADCDDLSPDDGPDAPEICADGDDDDCDGQVDEADCR